MYKIAYDKVQFSARILHIDLLCNGAAGWCRHLAELAHLYLFVDAYDPKGIDEALLAKPTFIVFGGGSWSGSSWETSTHIACREKIKKYLQARPDTVTWGYWGDARIESIDNQDATMMNMVYCAYDDAVDIFRSKGINAEYSPHPVDENIFFPDFQAIQHYDWCFAGTFYGNKRMQWIERLLKEFPNGMVLGRSPDNLFKETTFEQTANYYRQSKIIISINEDEFSRLRRYFSDRQFMAMRCHRLVLTNEQNGMNDLLQKDLHLEYYSSLPELMDQIRYFLKNGSERNRIAVNGYNVSEHYTMNKIFPYYCTRAAQYRRGVLA